MTRPEGTQHSIDKNEFTQKMIDSIRAAGEKGTITYNEAIFALVGDEVETHLQNAYDLYCNADSEERSSVIRQFTRGWFVARRTVPEAFEDARPDVLPVVRERAHFEWGCKKRSFDSDTPHLHLDGYHAVGLVYDFPECTVDIDGPTLEKWGVTFQQVYDTAIQNLNNRSKHVRFQGAEGGFYLADTRDDYDPSRLLLPELFADLDLQGDPVVMLPHRGVLLVAGAGFAESVAAMAKSAWELRETPRFWSGIPMRLVCGTWTSYQPPANHPASSAFRKLKLLSLSRDYAWQKEVLDQVHQVEKRNVFVANFSVMGDPRSNEPWSYCVWNEGICSLLPRADLIGFADESVRVDLHITKPLLVRWEVACEIVGHLMTSVDIHPERFAVEQFPNSDQIRRLRKKHLSHLLVAPKRR